MITGIDRAPLQAVSPGKPAEPRWVTPALIALLVGTAAFYLWNLAASGYASTFYSAAAQAGSQNWEAFLFGSADAGNTMTVDKPPVFLWLMSLSVRIFGLSSWSILVPQVALGVASVYWLYRIVKRRFGEPAGLIAGLVLALTPVAALMFRFDNPDAMLTFLLIGASWALLRGLDDGRTRWLVYTGVFMGFAFLTKDLAAMLILPALVLSYLLAGPVGFGRRVWQLCLAGVAMVVSAGWWVALVELLPAGSRPWIGGSTDNSFISVVLGGNGLDRLWGTSSFGGRVGPFSTGTGITRLFTGESAAQIGWLVPTGLVLLGGSLILLGRRPRTDPRRAALILWATWLLVSMAVYSLMSGTYHEYYNVSIAPPAAALIGAGAVVMWRARGKSWVRWTLVVALAITGSWSFVLLGRSPSFVPWLRWVVVGATVPGVAMLVLMGRKEWSRPTVAALILLAAGAGLAGPAAYSAYTVGTAHTGAMPSAGPSVTDGSARGGFGARPGGAGLFAENPTPGATILALLETDAGAYDWVAATTGSTNAAEYQLATQDPVIGIGGFNGGGVAPSLAQFQASVAAGRIHYYIVSAQSGGFGGPGFTGFPNPGTAAPPIGARPRDDGPRNGFSANGVATQIQTWVAAHYTSRVVDSVTLYDLTATPTE